MTNGNSPDLLARLQADREHALAEAFVHCRPRLRKMVDRRLDQRLARRVDASDVLQEGYVEAAQRLGDYLSNPSMPFFLWLRFLVKQRIYEVHRRHFGAAKRDPRREEHRPAPNHAASDSSALAVEFSACMTSPSQAVARAELQLQLQQMIEGLDPLDREILALRHFEELSNNEAATELDISKSAASKRYVRALERLKSVMISALNSTIVN